VVSRSELGAHPPRYNFAGREVLKIGREACEANDTTLFETAISLVPQSGVEFFIRILLSEAIRNDALLILNNLVKNHVVGFHDLKASTVVSWPLASKETLQFLLVHG
jgi:hypothetical protein